MTGQLADFLASHSERVAELGEHLKLRSGQRPLWHLASQDLRAYTGPHTLIGSRRWAPWVGRASLYRSLGCRRASGLTGTPVDVLGTPTVARKDHNRQQHRVQKREVGDEDHRGD